MARPKSWTPRAFEISNIVGISPTEPDDIWVTEVWRSEADHDASLSMEGVPALIAKARPLIAGGTEAVRTIPLGGKGLTS